MGPCLLLEKKFRKIKKTIVEIGFFDANFFLQKKTWFHRDFLICGLYITDRLPQKIDFSTEAKLISLGDYKTTTKNLNCQEKKLRISKNLILYFFLKNTLILLKINSSRSNLIKICNFPRISNEKLYFLLEF
jgi:hypothetical protein